MDTPKIAHSLLTGSKSRSRWQMAGETVASAAMVEAMATLEVEMVLAVWVVMAAGLEEMAAGLEEPMVKQAHSQRIRR
eukprot:1501049-Prymnesium_polylepis.1